MLYLIMFGIEIAISEALAEKLRLRIVLLLWDSTVCVKCLTQVLEHPQSTISRHLAVLRRSGIVRDERKGMYTYYYLDFQGEFGDLKRRLVKSYYEVLKDKNPYKTDTANIIANHSDCSSGCSVPGAQNEDYCTVTSQMF